MNGRNYNINLDSTDPKRRSVHPEYELEIGTTDLDLGVDQTDSNLSTDIPIIDLEVEPTELHNLNIESSINPFIPAELANYNNLINKPSINDVVIQGNLTLNQLNLQAIYYDSTLNWNNQPSLISERGSIYIYSDSQDNEIPNIKVGDGTTPLIDLPFITTSIGRVILILTQDLNNHINSLDLHVTQEEKEFWNNKVRAYISTTNEEELILTTH